MPIREPGVIVNISGEELPLPLPETRYGIGYYIFARSGPYKPTFVNVRNINTVYDGIMPMNSIELNYLLPDTSVFTMLLPNLGIRSAVGYMSFDNNTVNILQSLGYVQLHAASGRLLSTSKGHALWGLPTWLYGPPVAVVVIDSANNPTPNIANITRLNWNGAIFDNVNYTATNYTSIPVYPNLSDAFENLRIVSHVEVASGNWIIWFYTNDSNYVIYKKTYTDQLNNTRHQIIIYTDDDNFTYNTSSPPPISITYENNTSSTFTYNFPAGEISLSLENATYICPSYSGTSASIEINTNSNEEELKVVQGSNTLIFPLSYSPLDNGYYGFIDSDYIEIFKNGDVYSDILQNPTNTVIIGTSANYAYTTNIYFNHPRHENAVPARYFMPTYSLYDTGNFVAGTSPIVVGNVISTLQADNISHVVINGFVYLYSSFDLYSEWIDNNHNALVYRDRDVQRFTYSPLEVDLLSDYSGKVSFSFTKFIRTHDKFMFKIVGSPPLFSVPLAQRKSYIDNYWRLFDLQGFHYHRVQGHSTTAISPSTIYIRAVNSYGYQAIFGLRSTLSVSEIDHEFKLQDRESLLDVNVNTMVKDRVLGLWYFNNNLTEEPRRDQSPLGEENNARTAIRLSKLLAAFVERYIGEPNTQTTRERITNEVSQYIKDFLANNRTNLVDYKVICDDTNNTPADIANNRLNIRVEAKFGKSIKYIVVFERVLMAQ